MRIETFEDLKALLGEKKAREAWDAAKLPSVKASKYRNIKKELDGIKFDSTAEANYYASLLLLKKSGVVSSIELQPVFELRPKFQSSNGKNIRAWKYKADFKVIYSDGKTEIVDVKGFETRDYKIKRNQFLYLYSEKGLNFVEIKNGVRIEY